MTIDYKQICLDVCEVARKAGEFIRIERKNFNISTIQTKKNDNDIVTYVDKESEKLIVSLLRPLVDGARFLTEEKTVEAEQNSSPYCWIIDPIDGTTNFAHGIAPYCVSIALMEGEKSVVGVVLEVVSNECFYAWKDSKAYVNDEEISVSKIEDLAHSLIATGMIAGSESRMGEYKALTDALMNRTHGFRRIGSAAANIVYVAAGRFDGFAQFNLNCWDVAAGVLIAERAGATVTDFSGGDNYIFGNEVIVSNPNIYDDYKNLILGK
ncbi:MAG: inositol monophosphatase family protein [Rikenellaceae bacterium]